MALGRFPVLTKDCDSQTLLVYFALLMKISCYVFDKTHWWRRAVTALNRLCEPTVPEVGGKQIQDSLTGQQRAYARRLCQLTGSWRQYITPPTTIAISEDAPAYRSRKRNIWLALCYSQDEKPNRAGHPRHIHEMQLLNEHGM